MQIRQETRYDQDKVYDLIKEAFASAEHTDGKEQELVTALRENKEAFLPELSLVAECDGVIVGYILFTKMQVGADTVLALAPLAVKPAYQGQGIGTALVLEGHRVAEKLGYGYAVVLGSETYYPRMGYQPASAFGITIPEGFPAENYMAIRLSPDAKSIQGAVTYAREFGL